MKESFCPECDHRLKLGAHPFKGQRITCPECETKLTVIGLHPLELDVMAAVNQAAYSKHSPHLIESPCPICDEMVKLSPHAHEGQAVICMSCYTSLEVTNVDPLELDLALAPSPKHDRPRKSEPDKNSRKKSSQSWK